MPVVGRLKNNDLLLTGSINERLPVVRNGLIAHYPLDATTNTASLWGTGWSGTATGNGTTQDIVNSSFPVVGTQKLRFTGWFRKSSNFVGTATFFAYSYFNGSWNWQSVTISNEFVTNQWVFISREIVINGTINDVHTSYSQGISLRSDVTTGTLEWKDCHCYVENIPSYEANLTKNVDGLTVNSSGGDFSINKGLLKSTGSMFFEFYPTTFSSQLPIYSTRMDGGFDLLMQNSTSGLSYWRMYSSSTNSVQRTGVWFPQLNKWYKVAVTWVNNGEAKLYVDGNLVSTMSNCGDWYNYYNSNANARLSLGSGIRGSSGMKFKNLSIYNRVLSDSEIYSLTNSQMNLTKDGNLITKKFVEDNTLPVSMRSYKDKLVVKGQLKENQTLS